MFSSLLALVLFCKVIFQTNVSFGWSHICIFGNFFHSVFPPNELPNHFIISPPSLPCATRWLLLAICWRTVQKMKLTKSGLRCLCDALTTVVGEHAGCRRDATSAPAARGGTCLQQNNAVTFRSAHLSPPAVYWRLLFHGTWYQVEDESLKGQSLTRWCQGDFD